MGVRDPDGRTALHLAAVYGHSNIVRCPLPLPVLPLLSLSLSNKLRPCLCEYLSGCC